MERYKINNIRREIVLTIAYPFLWLAILFLWLYPKVWRKSLGHFFGKIYYRYAKKSKRYAVENLRRVYGADKTEAEIEEMTKEVFVNMAGTFIDYYATVYIKNRKRFFQMVHVTGEEHLRAAYEKGRGVICLIPHLSSWELSAVTPPMLGYTTSAASKAIKSWCIQRTMVWFRARRGMINFSRDGSYEKLVEVLKQGQSLILMIDQDTKVKGCFVDFFGHQAYTPLGASRLAMDTGAAVVPMAMSRTEKGDYHFEIKEALTLFRSGDREADLIANTQIQTSMMEYFIRQHPTQWVWMHRRWRTTPESLEQVRLQRAAEKERLASK